MDKQACLSKVPISGLKLVIATPSQIPPSGIDWGLVGSSRTTDHVTEAFSGRGSRALAGKPSGAHHGGS